MDLLVGLKAVKKTDVHEEEIDLLPLTEDLAEAIAGDFDEGKKTDDEIVEEQRNQDGDEASIVGRVCHNVTFLYCVIIPPALFVFKLRSLCKVTRSSPQRMEGFFECIKLSNTRQEARAKEKKVLFIPLALRVLIIDCVTRWNSLYFMLERAYTYRKVIPLFSEPHIELIILRENRRSMNFATTMFMADFTRIMHSLNRSGKLSEF